MHTLTKYIAYLVAVNIQHNHIVTMRQVHLKKKTLNVKYCQRDSTQYEPTPTKEFQLIQKLIGIATFANVLTCGTPTMNGTGASRTPRNASAAGSNGIYLQHKKPREYDNNISTQQHRMLWCMF